MSRSCLGMLMTVATLFAGAAWAGDVSTDAATSYATSLSAAGRIPKLQDCDVGVRFSGDAVPVEVRVTND